MTDTPFTPISLVQRSEYERCLRAMPQPAADYSFTNLWAWSEVYGLEWCFRGRLCWIRQTLRQATSGAASACYWAPVGDWAVDWTAMPELTPGTTLFRVPETLCDMFAAALPGRVMIEETPGQWEYVYETQALATLAGNKLHKKRNQANRFSKEYDGDYRPLTPDMIPAALELEAIWLEHKDGANVGPSARPDSGPEIENGVVRKVLLHWQDLPALIGGALFVRDRMAAFCIGEALNEQTLVVHFEKGLPDIRGVYQAINQHFAQAAGAGFLYINREQDEDDPGLRQAKQSYMPAFQVRKNTVRILA